MKLQSSAYWKKRTDEIMAYVDRTDIDFFDELQKIYTEGRQNVQKEIYAFYAQYAKDNQITMQQAQQQLRREDLSDYRANAEKYFKQAEKDPDLLKRLNEQYRAGKVTRLEALQLNLEWQVGKMNQTLHKSFDSYLKETAQYVYKKIAGGNSSSTLNRPALEQLVKTPFNGKNYSSSLWGNTDTLAEDLKQTLKNGFIRGQGPADMARELRKKYNVARSRSEAIIRTDGTNIINNAAAKRYMDFGLTKYKILVHLDERTTDVCKKIKADDETFLFEEYQPGKTAPPFHVNCRSGIVPDDSELGFEEEEELDFEQVDVKKIYDQSDGDRRKFAKELLSEYEVDAPVSIRQINARGQNGFQGFGVGDKASISEFVLQSNDSRSSSYQFKTALHEAYHSKMQGLEVPVSNELGKFSFEDWLSIEETMTEVASHYQMSLINDEKLMPAYPKYLSVNLPRLQKVKGFENSSSIIDFGKNAMKYRFNEELKTADWRGIHAELNNVTFDFYGYIKDNYVKELRNNRSEVLDMIYQNTPQFKQHDEYIQEDYDSFVRNIVDGKSLVGNQEMIGQHAMTALYRLVGVKKWK
ncbi:minor capsid protein [Jeotgalibaca porci]|uniref:minor capsid protein n=6 Tax=Jeotgalibaca porci TaxID=1868793 RepID=UPI0035A03866